MTVRGCEQGCKKEGLICAHLSTEHRLSSCQSHVGHRTVPPRFLFNKGLDEATSSYEITLNLMTFKFLCKITHSNFIHNENEMGPHSELREEGPH